MTANDLILAIVLVACAVFAVGCGNEALRINAEIARGMLELQAESGPRIREARVNAGVEAGREAHARGAPEAEAQAAASHAAEQWQCAVTGHQIYSMAVGAYIDSLQIAQQDVGFAIIDAIPFVRRAVDSYRVLAACLLSIGSDLLPEVPDFFNLIPSGWGVLSR